MLSTASSGDRRERGVVGGSGTRQQRPSGVTRRPDVRQNVTIENGQVTSYRHSFKGGRGSGPDSHRIPRVV